jgi:hypothetical protein
LFVAVALTASELSRMNFRSINSTCIDLAHYQTNRHQLTVRFTNGNKERFYRYSKVPTNVWNRILELDVKGKGGVGTYFVETVVEHPKEYPFEVIWLNEPPLEKKKAGDSK